MDDMTAFERQLGAGFKGLMGPSEPVDDAAIFKSVAATQLPRWRFQSMFSATKFVVAGGIVALFGGFLLAGVLTQQSGDVTPAAIGSASPAATPSTPFELPAVIPDGIESGTAETPLGTARWVHLSGDYVTQMPLGDFTLTWPTGFAVFDPPDGDGLAGSESNVATIKQTSRLWTSGNGIDWELQPLPTPVDAHWASLWLVDDVYWLVANVWSGDRLWRSTDGVTWEEFDPTELASPREGLAWDSRYSTPATAGDLTLIERSGGGPQQLFIIGDGEVTPVEVPWPTGTDAPDVTLYGAEDGIYAYVGDESTVWHTTDGRSWSELDPPSFLETTPSYPWFTVLPGSLSVIVYYSGDGVERGVGWETIDGIDWSPAPPGHPEGTHPLRLESGWFAFKDDEVGEELWMYLGDGWVSLSELGMERPDDRCWGNIWAAGNTTILRDVSCPAKARQGDEMWILTMNPST